MMNSEEFVKLLSAKYYTREELQSVSDICRSYPMFNVAHMLKVRILERLKLNKERDLMMAAVYAGDRKKLFEFVSPGVDEPFMGTLEGNSADLRITELHFLDEGVEHAELVIHNEEDGVVLTDKELLEIDHVAVEEAQPSGQDLNEAEHAVTDEPEKDSDEAEHAVTDEPEKDSDEAGTEEDGDKFEHWDEEDENEDEQGRDEEEDKFRVVEKQEVEMEESSERDESGVPAIDQIEESEDEFEDKKINLIERFINQEPGPIKADSRVTLQGDASLDSIKESDQLITDTLAKIYVKQGLHAKAIYAYEKLSLKFPEKSAYFAAQIDKIKNVTNT